MADQHENLYWLIPISALVLASIIGASAIEYKINTVLPNAEIELLEIKKMSCTEIKAKNSIGRYWTPENGKIGRAMLEMFIPLIREGLLIMGVENAITEHRKIIEAIKQRNWKKANDVLLAGFEREKRELKGKVLFPRERP